MDGKRSVYLYSTLEYDSCYVTAHQNGPSTALLPSGSKALHEVILSSPEQVYGKAIHRLTDTARSKGQLPFLFKTLCAGKGSFSASRFRTLD